MKKLLDISSEERNRILEMHQSATRRNYLTEAPEPSAAPQQTAAPQKAAATSGGLTNLIFTNKLPSGSAWYAATSLQVFWDQNKGAQNLKLIQDYPESKLGYAVIPAKGYNAGVQAAAPFYLINYEMDGIARLQGGKNPGKIQSFQFAPDPTYTKNYGEPTVTLNYEKEIKGYNQAVGEKGSTIKIGGMKVFSSNLPTEFNIMLTTPNKSVNISKDDKTAASSSPSMLTNNILVGIATITTNDLTNPSKQIKLYVPKGAQFGVPKASSAPTPVTPRT